MRILMIIDGLPGGGAEKVVLTLCKEMRQRGHWISLLSLRNICHYTLPKEVQYQELKPSTYPFSWKNFTTRSRFAYALNQFISLNEKKDGKYDLIFSHLYNTDRIVSSSHICSDNIWFCVHGMLSTAFLGHRHGLDRWIKKQQITQLYSNKNIISVSQSVAEDLIFNLSVTPRRLSIINNPFHINNILTKANEEYKIPSSPYLIHVGRFHPHKRHDRLLFAYAESNIPAPLVLVGSGQIQYINEIKRLVDKLNLVERVVFTGFHQNPYPLIKNAKMLILSSDSEGFGNVLIEALLCETPVVSTRCPGGPTEILEKVGMDHMLTALNSHALAEKMQEVYFAPPAPVDKKKLMIYDATVIGQQYLNLAM
ncbi:Glycosyl transferase group 1 family protein [Candidatus Erwinia haradaeae]|uniref:Glycosyl transferase group 1 family protein n=1 Tax=Candidatus Erwinia haradaeae TaxID=1922217 RepID=A0A451DCB0_9GAMM|nr:glycosyltransferase [Candidatus Erwinia haradaeae]VFP84071.1 Glycosyl transferase group 1 family protein [Candidatus Erwinia haradaeae]